jgi:hypothetical protein
VKHKPLPSIETISKYVIYNEEEGKLIRKSTKGRGRAKAGLEAGTVDKDGYRNLAIACKPYSYHRILWKMATGKDPGEMTVDHIDRDKTNNHISNLRLATRRDQTRNTDARGYVRDQRVKRQWNAYITVDGKVITSSHCCPLLARLWYLEKKAELHPSYTQVA